MALLMCDPYNFGVSYEINPWMAQQIGAVDVPLAREQWLALHQVLSCTPRIPKV
jgi:N-dimethylarginine dimethylaminohydrolase